MQAQLTRVQKLLGHQTPKPDKALKILRPLAKGKNTPWAVHHFIGIAYIQKKEFKTALKWLRKSVKMGAEEPETWHSISICHFNLAAFDKAIEFEKRALQKKENFFKGWLHLGSVYRAQARLDEALDCYKKANQLNPKSAGVAYRIGKIYGDQGELDKALKLFDVVLKINPDYIEASIAKAKVLQIKRQFNKAEECLQLVLQQSPHLGAQVQLAELYKIQGIYEKAIEHYERLVEEHPHHSGIRINYAICLQDIGRFDESEQHYLRALEDQPEAVLSLSNYLMGVHYNPERSKQEIFEAHKLWDQHFAPQERPKRPVPSVKTGDKKLRVGFISGGFYRHPVGWMITSGLEHLSKDQFEIYCYSADNKYDSITGRIHQIADKWKSVVGYNDEIIAQMIREDEIDILVDLSGHSGSTHLRAIAMEPAPVIIKWVGGLFNTTGLQSVDYLITDRHETPKGEEPFYTEKLVRMPDDYICFLPPDYAPDVSPLPAEKSGHITFGCFNNPSKVNNDILEKWANIMKQVPHSRLLLKSRHYETGILKERIIKQMEACGIPKERIIFEGESLHDELLACYNKIDIALDPWPYSGGLTTCEALWMGVPVITKPGPTFAGRHSTTHLINAGYKQWVADSWDEYIEKAVALAKDTKKLADIRSTMRKQMANSPVCDGRRFGAHLATAFREMWKQRVEGYEKNLPENEWQNHIEVKALSEEEIEAMAPEPALAVESLSITEIAKETEKLITPLEEKEPNMPKTNGNGSPVNSMHSNGSVHAEKKRATETYKIETKDGVTICTPADLNLLTPYVLLEQEQWYEPELQFVRDYLKPGMKAVDVGAGFGAYALPMARLAGEEGAVYAFEPGAVAKRHLEMSKLENRAENLEVIGRAVTDQTGKAKFKIGDTPELSKLDNKGTEEVSQTTLDAWWEFEGRPDIDFIKVDVNGNETKVLSGAGTLLAESSPVILLAISNEEKTINDPIEQLKGTGYQLYEYVPGPQLLTEFNTSAERDSYLGNLIAIKEDHAKTFIKTGLLYNEGLERVEAEAGLWKKTLEQLPWAKTLLADGPAPSGNKKYLHALDCICTAEQVDIYDAKKPTARSKKAVLLLEAAGILIELYNSGNTAIPIALTLTRVLNALGKREQAVEIIKQVMEGGKLGQQEMKNDLPFLLPLAEQDETSIKTNFTKWLTVRVTEAWVLLKDTSTYFSGEKEKKFLEVLDGNPENSESMKRRAKLLKQQMPNNSSISKNKSYENFEISLGSNNSGRPLFMHLCFNNMHTQSFLETLEETNNTGKHAHYAFVERQRSIPDFTVDLSEISCSSFFDGQKNLSRLLEITQAANPAAIIIHGLFFPWQKEFIKRIKTDTPIYWSIWGGDLYNPIKTGKPLHDLTQKISGVITLIDGDYELFEETYGEKHRIKSFSFGVSSKVNLDEISKITPRRIIVGNSGDPSNNHIQILKILSQKKDIQNYQLHIPFAYNGSKEYLKAVKKAVRNYGLENLTTFQTKFIPEEQYNKLLIESSYLICAHERQQALGTISSSLYYGNIVFVRKQIKKADGSIGINPTWRSFHKLGLTVQSIERFKDADEISNYKFPDKEMLRNTRDKISAKYDIQESVKLLKKGFDEIIKHSN